MEKEREEELFKEGVKEAVKELLRGTIDCASYSHGDAWIYNAILQGVKAAKLE